MKKKLHCLLILMIFLISIFFVTNKTSANELIGMMKVYKIKVNLINVDTEEYTIELIDGISNRIFETQSGNETGTHDFTIATDMDESHLKHYSIKVKLKDGEVKDFGTINIDRLIKIDKDDNDSSYSYEYNLLVKLLPTSVIIGIAVILAIGALVALIMFLKKHNIFVFNVV